MYFICHSSHECLSYFLIQSILAPVKYDCQKPTPIKELSILQALIGPPDATAGFGFVHPRITHDISQNQFHMAKRNKNIILRIDSTIPVGFIFKALRKWNSLAASQLMFIVLFSDLAFNDIYARFSGLKYQLLLLHQGPSHFP